MPAATPSIGQLLDRAASELGDRSSSPGLDAELLLGHVLGLSRAALRARAEQPVEPAAVRRFRAMVANRAAGEPVAYLTGRKGFWDLELEVGPDVLVPRPETELAVELALDELRARRHPTVLDLGTGSGAIALAIAGSLPGARVTAVDASDAALAVARRNATRAGLASRVEFLPGDWYGPVAGRQFDVIVANPPYLSASDPHLATLVREPASALVAGPTGLEAIAAVIAGAPAQLRPGGLLVVEHGSEQGAAVRQCCAAATLGQVRTHADAAGLERVTVARRPVASPDS